MSSPSQIPPVYRRPRSLAGPVVLILMGVVFLMVTMGTLSGERVALLFAHYWPVLLILGGAIKLIENFMAHRAGTRASGLGAGSILLLIIIIVFGLIASQAAKVDWGGIRDQIDVDNNGDFSFFGGHVYNYDGQLEQKFPDDANVRVSNNRGTINVTTSDDKQIKVVYHQRVRGESQDEADKRSSQNKPQISVEGRTVIVDAGVPDSNRWIATDLDITVPRKASLMVTDRKGDVNVIGRDGDLNISAEHSDVSASDINGKIALKMRGNSVRISQVSSDVSIEGRVNDVSVEDVKGTVQLNGEIMENIKLSKIARTVTFKSPRTDLEFARLDGDLDLDSGDLRASNVVGPARLLTRSKDIRLTGVSGDLRLQDENGPVEIHLSKLGNVQIDNRSADIDIYLPEKGGFQLNARSRNGEITTDFNALKIERGEDQATASGTIGSGGPHLVINNEHGGIGIHKGLTVAQEAPPAPRSPKTPPTPDAPAVTEN